MKRIISSILIFTLISLFISLQTSQGQIIDVGSTKDFSYIPHGPITINDDNDFLTYSFPGYGNSSHPYLIENFNITTTASNAIYIYGTTKHFIIRNCLVSAGEDAIYVRNIASGTASILENTAIDNLEAGIYVRDADDTLIKDNTCKECRKGIEVWYSKVNVTDNLVQDNLDGIHLYYSSFSNASFNTGVNNGVTISVFRSDNVTITFNDCSQDNYSLDFQISKYCVVANNTIYSDDIYGMKFYASNFSLICNNSVHDNSIGIRITPSANNPSINNTFCYNLIKNNINEGIFFMSGTANNTIHHNQFIDNNLGGSSQAYDLGENNIWYDIETNEGNYWSDWDGTGSYQIGGFVYSIDPYPLDEDFFPPQVHEFSRISFIIQLLIILPSLIIIRMITKTRKRGS